VVRFVCEGMPGSVNGRVCGMRVCVCPGVSVGDCYLASGVPGLVWELFLGLWVGELLCMHGWACVTFCLCSPGCVFGPCVGGWCSNVADDWLHGFPPPTSPARSCLPNRHYVRTISQGQPLQKPPPGNPYCPNKVNSYIISSSAARPRAAHKPPPLKLTPSYTAVYSTVHTILRGVGLQNHLRETHLPQQSELL